MIYIFYVFLLLESKKNTHMSSTIIVATAKIDGNYLAHSSLSLEKLESFHKFRQHIKKNVEAFLDKPGYSDAMEDFSHIVIKDILSDRQGKSKERIEPILEIKREEAINKEELKAHIDMIIDFMEECYKQYQQDEYEYHVRFANKKRELVLSPEDQPDNDGIVVQATGQNFHMYFNQAPNHNGWDQLDICIHYFYV